jgi:hypothetical protein
MKLTKLLFVGSEPILARARLAYFFSPQHELLARAATIEIRSIHIIFGCLLFLLYKIQLSNVLPGYICLRIRKCYHLCPLTITKKDQNTQKIIPSNGEVIQISSHG